MIAFWELEIKKMLKRKVQKMNLESILSSVKTSENSFNLNNSFKTIRYISEKEYSDKVHKYVEPMFTETQRSSVNVSPRFIFCAWSNRENGIGYAHFLFKAWNILGFA